MCEEIGDDVVVLDGESQSVLTVSGVGAAVFKRMLAGELVREDELGVAELVAQGIIVAEVASTVSRRTLIVSGAAMGAGGIVALSLPGVGGFIFGRVASPYLHERTGAKLHQFQRKRRRWWRHRPAS